MSDHGSSAKAILYAFTANLGIALAKLAASIYTHSGSMMAEAIHSFADCGNQVLLYLGLRQAQKPPDAKHPLGYGKVTYFWSFIVALLLFSMGGLFSMYEGWHKLHAPEELHQAWIALAVLGASILLEFGSLVGCLREIKKLRKDKPLWRWVGTTRNAELVVVLGEDLAALLGLALAFVFVALATVTGNPVFDAVGSIVIGIIQIMASVRRRAVPHSGWVWGVIGGALSILFGVLVLVWPNAGLVSIIWIIGIWATIWGITLIILGVQLRKVARSYEADASPTT